MRHEDVVENAIVGENSVAFHSLYKERTELIVDGSSFPIGEWRKTTSAGDFSTEVYEWTMRKNVLDTEIEPEVLERTPPWFRRLREAYQRLKEEG